MKSKELNLLLVENFPSLYEKYIEEVSWQEGNDTGSHIVYGDVFTPYLIQCIEDNKQDDIISMFNYIEMLLELGDSYTDEVVAFSIIESIEYLVKEKVQLIKLLGEKSKKILNEF